MIFQTKYYVRVLNEQNIREIFELNDSLYTSENYYPSLGSKMGDNAYLRQISYAFWNSTRS